MYQFQFVMKMQKVTMMMIALILDRTNLMTLITWTFLIHIDILYEARCGGGKDIMD